MPTSMETPITPEIVPSTSSPDQPNHLLRGLSLFRNLPFRSCEEAGIPNAYCACMSPTAYTKNLTIVRMAAEAIVRNINSKLPQVCTPLEVGSIIASATINSTSSTPDDERNHTSMFLISIITDPGNFRYEALVQYNNLTGQFTTHANNIFRTNKKERGTGCLPKHQQAFYELFCYCSG